MTQELFRGADALVVIDDWKSGVRSAEDPTCFLGRVFLAKDSQCADLYSLLSKADAGIWHASGDRSTTGFLFSSGESEHIVSILGDMRTLVVDMLNGANAFQNPEIRERWARIRQVSAAARTWPESNPYAISLFRYLEFFAGYLSQLLPGARVRFLVDRMDWLTPGVGELISGEPGLRALGSGERIPAEIVMISEKDRVGAQPYLPLLGLVDSEAWAFGRFQSLKFPDGSTVRQRALAWRDGGRLSDVQLFNEQEFKHLLSVHERHDALLRYWHQWNQWGVAGRAICLAENESATMRRAREAAVLVR